jgi:outer membrane protein insertion porin family
VSFFKQLFFFFFIVTFSTLSYSQSTPSDLIKTQSTIEDDAVITDISFEGLDNVQEKTVLDALTVKKNSKMTEFTLEIAKKNIENLGLFSEVTGRIESNKRKNNIVFKVKENKKINNILIEGNSYVSTEELMPLIQSQENTIYNINQVRKDIQAIEAYYKKNNYDFAKVFKLKVPNDTNESLIFYISEGIIDTITITGNLKTRDYVVLRELTIEPGEPLSVKKNIESIKRIRNTGFFTDVLPDIQPSKKNDHSYTLTLILNERETMGNLGFGGGYSPTYGFSLNSDLYWNNILGTGQLIMVRGNLGIKNSSYASGNRYQIKYHNPWMWNDRKSLTLRTWLTDMNTSLINPFSNSTNFSNIIRKGTDISIGIPLTYSTEIHHTASFETVEDPTYNLSYRIMSYKARLSYDTRDYRMNPRKGVLHYIDIEKSIRFTQREIEFTRVNLLFNKYIPFLKKNTVKLTADMGVLYGADILEEMRKYGTEFYRIGGPYSVRGYDEFYPFASGNYKSILSTEFRYLFNADLTGFIFVDTGYASTRAKSVLNYKNYKIGKGVGINFLVPGLGPIRITFGIDDRGTSRIQFISNNTF